ncbi:MAG: hypothetical protein Q605_AUC00049G0001, partial [Actinomyces urogenitalis DORA_12]
MRCLTWPAALRSGLLQPGVDDDVGALAAVGR